MPLSRSIISRTLTTPLGEAAYKVVEILHDAGFECLWVGGAVRNMAMDTVPREIDMATAARPEDVVRLFPKSDDADASLGTIVVSLLGHTFEITTYRTDAPTGDGRKPDHVVFASRNEDAARRDATINALYFNPITREVFDDFGGLTDITERLVKFIGDPATRLREDALRALRMVRLRATIDGQYDPATYEAITHAGPLVEKLSGTRKLEELEKILACPSPVTALHDLQDLGILTVVLPDVSACKGVAQPHEYHHEGDVFLHLLHCTTKFTQDHGPDVRLAALLHDIGKPQTYVVKERIRFDGHAEASAELAAKALTRLQLPAARVKKIEWLIRHHMMMGSFSTLSVERKAHWYFHPWFKELLELFYLDAAGTEPTDLSLYESIIADYDEFLNAHPRPEKPLLNGDEVMEILGITPGARVGEVMEALHAAQVGKTVSTKKEAREFVKKLAA